MQQKVDSFLTHKHVIDLTCPDGSPQKDEDRSFTLSPATTVEYEMRRSDTVPWVEDDYEFGDRLLPERPKSIFVDVCRLPQTDGEWRPKRPSSW
jgi:hypothetical protein